MFDTFTKKCTRNYTAAYTILPFATLKFVIKLFKKTVIAMRFKLCQLIDDDEWIG